MEELCGVIDKIVYTSPDRVFSVFKLSEKESGRHITVTGSLGVPTQGESVILRGCWVQHPRFGMQFKALFIEVAKPETSAEIQRYLSSGIIDGIGESLAEKIVNCFGKETLSVMDNDIESLLHVSGIGEKTLCKIKESYRQIKNINNIALLLQRVDISTHIAVEIQKVYGDNAEQIIKENPYRMIQDIRGVGFKEADKIALYQGVKQDSEQRIVQGIMYTLSHFVTMGHCCGPLSIVCNQTATLLRIDEETVCSVCYESIELGEIPCCRFEDTLFLYLPSLYEAEVEASDRIKALLQSREFCSVELSISKFEEKNHILLADEQKNAIESAMNAGVVVITGGPGTGKTTLIKALIMAAEQHNKTVHLMAPTGRAAKRLALMSACNADTIHKALESEAREKNPYFGKNEWEPLTEDIIIVDEASMIDLPLFYHLVCALKENATLVLVGDIHQLPPVGAGAPLKDLIASGIVPVVTLHHIFRQEEGSSIIVNADRVREGKEPISDNETFILKEVSSEEEAFNALMKFCDEYQYIEKNKLQMQILSPMYKGICGVDHINRRIQALMHSEKEINEFGFCVGDKVMQRRNNYEKGVYNGDIGIVWAVNDNKIFISFDDKEVVYEGEEKKDLQLAYAVTVHKSQGSEYEIVIMILLPSQARMLQRNLLYTGITRAKAKTILISTKNTLYQAIKNYKSVGRCSLFLPLLKGEVQC
ncbi:ATP-dependent RecD-like DNA helicase [Dialister pneumosintes]|uniref:ATP-dependent RecD2 DNA helicase n=1 Tax=Dialister pneumosintes TaxID=39950 RepID=A0A1B3WDS3_9FIRM|nr:ATP-dependent RecD-like DNA helicase [Dialister pneumosintes]AOH39115.1 helicase RecD [Dialister pneumosintes]MBS6480389.1 ATP-dependent RecD-like DNA helicase [Dialister sp.]